MCYYHSNSWIIIFKFFPKPPKLSWMSIKFWPSWFHVHLPLMLLKGEFLKSGLITNLAHLLKKLFHFIELIASGISCTLKCLKYLWRQLQNQSAWLMATHLDGNIVGFLIVNYWNGAPQVEKLLDFSCLKHKSFCTRSYNTRLIVNWYQRSGDTQDNFIND